jgi:hypothetical protein
MDLPVVMIDGIHFRERVILVALGIDTKGNKHVLGLREGSTESTRVVRSLLSDLVERGLDADRVRLWVIDGGKALRKAIVDCFGQLALIQRCQEHKRRNGAAAGHHRRAVPHAAHDQPDREPQRIDCTLHAKRQALEGRADDAALGGRRIKRRQGTIPETARTL